MAGGRLLVGRVVKPHGIRGEVSIEILSDRPERFVPGARMFAGETEVVIATARPHQGRMLVCFEHVADRDDAERMRGVVLAIEREEATPLPPGSYYPFQLEGLTVVDPAGEELGTLLRVDEGAAHDLWIVRARGRDVLVPAVREIVKKVDLDARTIVVDAPEGLF